MRLIDRYLLRQFLQTFLICFISLAGLYIVIDAFNRLDDFGGEGVSFAEAAKTAGQYYALQSLSFFNRTSGILAMIAAMFTVTWIQRHNEMTALMAAGIPRLQILRPVLIAGVVVAITAAGIREFVIPGLRHELSLDSKDLSGENAVVLKPRQDYATDIRLGGSEAMLKSGTIVQPSFWLPPYASRFGMQLVAKTAQYKPTEGNRPSGYLLRGVSQPEGINRLVSLTDREGKPVIVTPTDADWLAEDEAFVVSGLSFELLAAGPQWRDLASTSELVRELASPSTDLGPDVRVAIHTRILQPFLDITLLMLGLPLVVSRGAKSPFIAMGLSVLVVTAFFLLALGGQALGATGWLRPSLAAWLPLIVFVPIAAAQSESLRQ